MQKPFPCDLFLNGEPIGSADGVLVDESCPIRGTYKIVSLTASHVDPAPIISAFKEMDVVHLAWGTIEIPGILTEITIQNQNAYQATFHPDWLRI